MTKEVIREIQYDGVKFIVYIFTCNDGAEIPAVGTSLESCKKQVVTILKLKK